LSVGRLCEQKDFATILHAFSLVKTKSKTELWLVGDGHLKENLIEDANNLGIQKQVRFFGWKTDTSKYYKSADIFLFSSKWEGFGHVILEAMNYGLPIIATDTAFGPREILKGNKEYGILIKPGRALEMAQAIDTIIDNKGLLKRYTDKSISRVDDFTIQKTISEYRTLISKTL
jgi:glycosyltransferase involved in cell wall biosynthesis